MPHAGRRGKVTQAFSLICDPICFQWLTRTIFGVFGVTFSFKPAPPAAWLQADPASAGRPTSSKERCVAAASCIKVALALALAAATSFAADLRLIDAVKR